MPEPTSSTAVPETNARASWLKRLLIWTLILSPLIVLFNIYIAIEVGGNWALRDAVEEADRLDLGWRLEELEAKRKVLPDSENSALKVLPITGIERRGTGMLPSGWPDEALDKIMDGLAPEAELTEQQLTRLRYELTLVAPALEEARKIVSMPEGRYPLKYTPDGLSTVLPHIQPNRTGVKLLCYDAILLAQEGRMADALVSCRAALNMGRAIGDEPTLISMLVRIAVRSIALHTLERLLAQGEPTEASLAAVQKLLEDEVQQPLLLIAIRGERALADRMMHAIQSGQVSMVQTLKIVDGEIPKVTGFEKVDHVIYWFRLGSMKKNRAALLRFNSQAVEIAKRPVEGQMAEFDKLAATYVDQPLLVRQVLAAVHKVAEVYRRDQAVLRCAIVMVAAERYRRAHGKWPESLEQLTPKFVAKVPLDPYVGRPLKFRRLNDRVLIYAVGPDGKDDGGNFGRSTPGAGYRGGTDPGLQLWDVAKRRQPPMPPKGATP